MAISENSSLYLFHLHFSYLETILMRCGFACNEEHIRVTVAHEDQEVDKLDFMHKFLHQLANYMCASYVNKHLNSLGVAML